MTETSPEKDGKSKALPKALVKDEEEGVASAAGEDEQPEPRKYKWLAVFLMSVALVSISANAGLTTALVTKAFGTHTQEHVYAVALTSRLDSAGASVVAEVPCVKVLEAIASTKNGDNDQGLVMIPIGNGEFSTTAISAVHYHVHKESFGIEQITLSGDREVSYNVSCETSMAACETQHPGLLCDVVPSAVTSSSRRALLTRAAYLELYLESEISMTTPAEVSSSWNVGSYGADEFYEMPGESVSWELTCEMPKWMKTVPETILSITGGGPLAYSATHAVPRGDPYRGRARCTLHVKPSYSDGWSGAIWTAPDAPLYGTATQARATWTAPGWTDQSFIIGRIPGAHHRWGWWGDVGDTVSFYVQEKN